MQEFPQGADRAAGRFGFAETHGLRPWRRRRGRRGGGPGPRPPAVPCRAQALSLRPRPLHTSAAPQETAAFPFPEEAPRPPRTLLPHRRSTARRANRPPDGFRGGLRPPPRRRRAPPALRAALPLQAPRHPHAKAPAGTAGASLCQYSSIGSPSGPAAIFLSVSSSISCRSAVR